MPRSIVLKPDQGESRPGAKRNLKGEILLRARMCYGIDMQKVKLDDIDRRILEQMRDNGRITNVELAKRVGISAPPCLRRVRALEDSGYIRGYHAELNNELLGYGMTVFAWVGLHSQAETDLEAFEELAASWEPVLECHMLTGEVDFVLKIVAKDWDTWQTFLTTELTPAPNVASVKTHPVLRRSKSVPGVPLDAIDPT